MLINVSEDYIINSLSDMDKIFIGKLGLNNKIERIGSIKYDYVTIKENKLIFYIYHARETIIISELEVNKIDFIDFDNEVIVIK